MSSNMSSSNSDSSSESNNDHHHVDLGAPLPNFGSARSIQLQTIAPALGVPQAQLGHASTPDYLDYDPKGRGIVVTMFANAGCAYLLGITGGGLYGLKTGLQATPSTRFRVQLNSVLNHCGRHGSRAGNTMGVFSVLYSFYEGMADQYELDDLLGLSRLGFISPNTSAAVAPAFGAMATGLTYFAPSGPRVAALGGAIGLGSVFMTYTAYSLLGIPPGSGGFLFF